jgi:hypothetical protein
MKLTAQEEAVDNDQHGPILGFHKIIELQICAVKGSGENELSNALL